LGGGVRLRRGTCLARRSTPDPLGVQATAMAKLEPVFPEEGLQRRYFSVAAESLPELVDAIEVREGHFALFLACDASNVSTDEIGAASSALLDRGIAYLVAWGPDCERVHDVFDEVEVQRSLDEKSDGVVMTTWHAGESLQEALFFFLFSASPTEAFEATCNTAIAASVCNRNWAKTIRESLGSVETLKEAVGG